MKSYVLDTSALFAFRSGENGADTVEEILRRCQAHKAVAYISFVTLTELFYVTWQRSGREAALHTSLLLKTLPLQRIDPDEELLLIAGEFKALHELSLADAFIAATAVQKKSILVHKDPEYEALKDRVEMIRLPYKK